MLNSEIRNSVEGHISAVTVEPPTDFYLNFCTKRETKLVNNTQQSIVVALEPLLVASELLAGLVFCSNPENVAVWAQSSINVVNYSNIPTVQAQQTGHKRATNG